MNQSTVAPAAGESGLCAWFGFWWPFAALGFLAIVGAFFASSDNAPGDETCGLVLSLAAVALAFLRLKRHFDGAGGGWAGFLLVDDLPNLVVVIVVFAALALGGLVVAAGAEGSALQTAGVALSLASALAVLLSIKRVFDVAERRR